MISDFAWRSWRLWKRRSTYFGVVWLDSCPPHTAKVTHQSNSFRGLPFNFHRSSRLFRSKFSQPHKFVVLSLQRIGSRWKREVRRKKFKMLARAVNLVYKSRKMIKRNQIEVMTKTAVVEPSGLSRSKKIFPSPPLDSGCNILLFLTAAQIGDATKCQTAHEQDF